MLQGFTDACVHHILISLGDSSGGFTEAIMHFLVSKCTKPLPCQCWCVSMALSVCFPSSAQYILNSHCTRTVKPVVHSHHSLGISTCSGIYAMNVRVIREACSHCQTNWLGRYAALSYIYTAAIWTLMGTLRKIHTYCSQHIIWVLQTSHHSSLAFFPLLRATNVSPEQTDAAWPCQWKYFSKCQKSTSRNDKNRPLLAQSLKG